MNIKIPTKISRLKLRHVEAFNLLEGKEIRVSDKIKVISILTGISEDKLKRYEWKGLRETFNKIVECFNTYEQQELPLSLTYGGVKYNLVEQMDKMPTGWFIDADTANLEVNPEYLASLCYIEDGMSYAEKDKHNNIKNPLKDRAEVFKNNMPLDTFLDLTGFFLLRHKQYKIAYTQIQQVRIKRLKEKEERLNGKK